MTQLHEPDLAGSDAERLDRPCRVPVRQQTCLTWALEPPDADLAEWLEAYPPPCHLWHDDAKFVHRRLALGDLTFIVITCALCAKVVMLDPNIVHASDAHALVVAQSQDGTDRGI